MRACIIAVLALLSIRALSNDNDACRPVAHVCSSEVAAHHGITDIRLLHGCHQHKSAAWLSQSEQRMLPDP
jgi:hypothetical protein